MKNLTSNIMILGKARLLQHLCLRKVLRTAQQKNGFTSSSFKAAATDNPTDVPVTVNSSQMQNESADAKENPSLKPVPKKQYGLSKVEEHNVELVESLKEGNIFYPYDGPYDRCWKILSEDFRCCFRRIFYAVTGVKLGNLEHVYFPRHTDILIVGGGILGLTIAYTIKEKFPHGPDVMVVEKDGTFPPVSTNLTQAMMTHQLFNDDEEIPILKYGAEFFSSFSRNTQISGQPPFKLAYEPLGSLALVDNSNLDKTLKRIESLKLHEINVKVLDPDTLKHKFPWLNIKDVIFGSLGMSHEGLIDPWAYIYGLKSKCINLGVKFITAEVIDFGYIQNMPFRVICKLPDGTYNSVDFSRCILACGMEALNFTEILNSSDKMNLVVKLPLQEQLRYEYCFYNPEGPGLNTPIIIDPSGTYFRREGLVGHYIAGVSSVPSSADDEEKDPYYIYHNRVKPFLEERVPKFKDLRLLSGWVDLQEYCFSNDIGVMGCHPEAQNIYYALGFSHLGLQYVPAVARAAMESILYEDYQTINFSSFHVENLWRKQHLEADRKRRELLESQQRIAIS